jgi:glyoxylase-like metal-dependent hydrolase (beta-lactamase superfamily II)
MTDPVAGQASIKRRRRDAAQPGTTVIFGHDPAQGTTLRHAPDYYS